MGDEGVKFGVVSSKELGTNCWLPCRFIQGGRCAKVMTCNYPEKRTCKAVDAEIKYLNELVMETQRKVGEMIAQLVAVKESDAEKSSG